MNRSEILTVAEVADILRVHPRTVYRLVKRGELAAVKIRADLRFSSDVFALWLSKRSRDPFNVSRSGY